MFGVYFVLERSGISIDHLILPTKKKRDQSLVSTPISIFFPFFLKKNFRIYCTE